MQKTTLALKFGGGLTLKRFTITHSDLTASASTQSITLFTLGAGSKILGVNIKHSTAFSGGSLTSMTVSVGSSAAGNDGFATAFDIFQTVGATVLQETAEFKSATSVSQSVTATFTGSHNVDTATAGSVDIDVLVMDVTTPLS